MNEFTAGALKSPRSDNLVAKFLLKNVKEQMKTREREL